MSIHLTLGDREYFPGIGQIIYEGPDSKNPLAFKFYDPDQVVAGKKMRDHFRFAIAYWHTFCGTGEDPFGPGTQVFPWDESENKMQAAKDKLDAAFEFFTKLGVGYYCFHDRDLAPAGNSIIECENNLATLIEIAKKKQQASGVKLLWGTANVFSHPRYMNGAATNPDFAVVTHV
ncbi:xylose isomerase, partial [candidate division KSB1 bacterium]